MQIGKHTIKQGGRPYLIAEIGQAHEGDFIRAKSLTRIARAVGADAIKWQYHLADHESRERYYYWKAVEFPQFKWQELRESAKELGLDFIIAPFSLKAVELCRELEPDAWKVPSAPRWPERLKAIVDGDDLPIILSTGMSDLNEIDNTIDDIGGLEDIALLQCTSMYPTPLEKVGLNVIDELYNRYAVPVGLSDHSGKPWPAIAAMARGAAIIEAHLCFDKNSRNFPDLGSSLTVNEFKMLADARDAIDAMREPVNKDWLSPELLAAREKYGRPARVGKP